MHYIDYNERKYLYKYKNKLYRKIKNIKINKYNKKYLKKEIKKDLKVGNYFLDKEQKKAILTDEINTLVIAGAGSGKSLTIIGKINYLIERGIKPQDIICISFTNEACKSLKSKLNHDVEVLTFHKLALNIIGYNKYKICSSNLLDYVIDEYFNSIIHNNPDMVDIVRNISNKKVTFKKLLKSKELINFKKLIKTFINLYKANDYPLNYFCQLDDKKYHNLLRIIIDIFILYTKELSSQNLIDFDDMISIATKEVNKYGIKKNYKYIIIDEFQDTSLVKLNLIKAIIEKTNAKLFCVGDDFQSIYKFTGCDSDIFLNISKYVGQTRVLKITHTYRNSQNLARVSTKFILKNKYQITKHIKSKKQRQKPIKIVKHQPNILEKLLDYLISNNEKNILILGRNNKDIYKYITSNLSIKDNIITYKNKDININIKYLTIHRSKGLEEECVVLINLYDDLLGMPCKLKGADILSLISKQDKYPFEEERRLFYVALTRTKKDIYLICPLNLSIFVKEIIHDSKKHIEYLNL